MQKLRSKNIYEYVEYDISLEELGSSTVSIKRLKEFFLSKRLKELTS